MEMFFNGKQVVEGKATAFTNGAIEPGIIHCRTLLKFLGLSARSQTEFTECTTFTRHDEGNTLLEIAFRGVPVLIINAFYVPLGLVPPKCELQPRKQPM